MPRPRKPHRGRNAWKKDILRLTCLLRLRCAPPVPYPLIADFLMRTKSRVIERLVRTLGPEEWKYGGRCQEGVLKLEARTWLVQYLEQIYDIAERELSVQWLRARNLDEEVVREEIVGLGWGFVVVEARECRLQSQWKAVGDWRSGSEPEPKVERGENAYPTERNEFFEDMVSGIVDGNERRRTSKIVGSRTFDTFDDEDVVWQPPKLGHNGYRQDLQDEYEELLAKLKEVKWVINDCNWKIYGQEADAFDDFKGSIHSDKIPSLPDLGQHFSDVESVTTISDAEDKRPSPSIIVVNKEYSFDDWHENSSNDGVDSGPDLMKEATEKAFAEWQGYGRTQGWLEMSR